MVKMLLEKGANIEVADRNGQGPLHRAAYLGHGEVVRILREKREPTWNLLMDLDGDHWMKQAMLGHVEIVSQGITRKRSQQNLGRKVAIVIGAVIASLVKQERSRRDN